MPEYIEREAAIKAINALRDSKEGKVGAVLEKSFAWAAASREIEHIPAADVAPVGRCKDCKHCDFGEWLFAACRKRSKYHNFTVSKEELCNFGEEKKATWVPADYKPYLFVQCSRCARRVPKSNQPEQCPRCGAKMDLEV